MREIETMNTNPVDKTKIDPEAKPLRKIFMKSVFARKEIKQGELITESHLTTKKPGTGIPANQIGNIVGKKATRNVHENSILSTEDFS